MTLLAAILVSRVSLPQEWNDYQAILAQCRGFRVLAFRDGDGGEAELSLAYRKPNEFVITDEERRGFWNGTKTTSFRVSDNRRTQAASRPSLGVLGNLDPFGEEGLWSERFARLTLVDSEGHRQTGFRIEDTDVDVTRWFEVWFNPKTHLPTRLSRGAFGMVPFARRDYTLEWMIDPHFASNEFVPKPFADEEGPGSFRKPGVELRPWAGKKGYGRLRILAPPGDASAIEIRIPSSGMSFSVASGPVDLPTERYTVFTSRWSWIAHIVAGQETIYRPARFSVGAFGQTAFAPKVRTHGRASIRRSRQRHTSR